MPGPHLSADPEGNRPLTARSVVLSLLLGSHPDPLSSAQIVRAAELFGSSPATARVALSRAVTAGDVARDGHGHRLGPRLLARQARQESAIDPVLVPWSNAWESAVVVVSGRGSAERAALREHLTSFRLAELRSGVWMRPANLDRPAGYVGDPVLLCFRSEPVDQDPGELARTLWDLDAWAATGSRLLETMGAATAPGERFLVAARVVRHLVTDPILPAELLPADWPGVALRESYAAYRRELRAVALTPA